MSHLLALDARHWLVSTLGVRTNPSLGVRSCLRAGLRPNADSPAPCWSPAKRKETNQAASSSRALRLTGSFDEFNFGRELLHDGKLRPVGEGLTTTQYSTVDLHALLAFDDGDARLDFAIQRISGVLARNLVDKLSAAIEDDVAMLKQHFDQ